MPMKPFPSSWMKDRKSDFCWASISRSPPVKKNTASKLLRFLALYSSFFLVNASASVRIVESHKPVSVPRRSTVAIACDTDSCRYPFSSPMTRMCFFSGVADRPGENAPRTAMITSVRGAIFILELSDGLPFGLRRHLPATETLLFATSFFSGNRSLGDSSGSLNQVEEADHHLVPALLTPNHRLRRVWILGIVRRIVEMRGAFNPSPWGQHNRLVEVVPKLPVPVVLRHAQDRPRLTTREHHAIFEILSSGVHVRMNRGQYHLLAYFKRSVHTVVGIAGRNFESAIARRQGLDSFFRWLFGENQTEFGTVHHGLSIVCVVNLEHNVGTGFHQFRLADR